MKNLMVTVKDEAYDQVINFLRLVPQKTIHIISYDNDDLFTPENAIAHEQARKELKKGKAIDLEQAKRKLLK